MVRNRSCPAVSHCYKKSDICSVCFEITGTHDLKLHCLAIEFDCSDFLVRLVSSLFGSYEFSSGVGKLTKSTPIVEI